MKRWRIKRRAKSWWKRGQMVVFLALTFQILFVFFAMVVSVGSLVHQKINLQNAADLASYYAASKQAEILNAIGHSNYQIRQAWKLLAFRYRVLTQLGVRTHPWRTGQNGEVAWSPNGQPNSYLSCVTYESHWARTPPEETSCFRVNNPNYTVPALPIPQVSATFLDFNNQVRQLAFRLREAAFERCRNIGFINWFFMSMVYSGYKQDVASRKAVILGLLDYLTRQGAEARDLDGQFILTGVEQTVDRNLTDAHDREGISIDLYNGLSADSCSSQDVLMPEIRIDPAMWYADFTGEEATGCSLLPKNIKGSAAAARPTFYADFAGQFDPGSQILEFTRQEFDTLFHSSLGYEKNPWCMAYSAVKVQSAPSIPFLPLSRKIPIVARSVAKPFGGRVGPWYQSRWPSGSNRSSGGEPVDALLPPRIGGAGADPAAITRLPNYSRFPGDTLGLTSAAVQFSFGSTIDQVVRSGAKMNFDWWNENLNQFNEAGNAADPLAFDLVNNSAPAIRMVEMMAIRPDLFDITYYSVEPNYTDNYLSRLQQNTFTLQGASGTVRFRGDIGSRPNSFVNVLGQMTNAAPNLETQLNHYVSASQFGNLLTGWAEQSTIDYSMDTAKSNFGVCNQAARDEVPTPGQCQFGGRVGYSVKLVNPDMMQESLPIGGGGASGQILNPLPADF